MQNFGVTKFQKKHLDISNMYWLSNISNISNIVMIRNKKNYPQMYFFIRYEIKEKKMLTFNDIELDLDDSDDSNSE